MIIILLIILFRWYHHSGDSSGLPAGSGGHNSGDSSGGAAGPSAGSGGPGSHYRGSSRYSANNHSSQLRTSNSAESQMQHKPRLVSSLFVAVWQTFLFADTDMEPFS